MKIRRAIAIVMAGLAVPLIAACEGEPSSSGAHGTVVDRREKWIKSNHVYYVTVQEDGGHQDEGRVTKTVYRRCAIGKRWPACKKASDRPPAG